MLPDPCLQVFEARELGYVDFKALARMSNQHLGSHPETSPVIIERAELSEETCR